MASVPPSVTMSTTTTLQSTALAARAQYELAFQISPIILQGGIAASAQGGLQPIIAYTNSDYGSLTDASDAFAQYIPLPGSTLISQTIGAYPFANQTVAANATIQQPLTLSMLMIAPVNQHGGFLTKLTVFSALQASLQLHNASGGTYIVATPALVYNNLLMTAMTDVTGSDSEQKQIMYQIDFVQPLLTQAAAAAAQSNLIAKVTGGGQIVGTPGWTGNTGALPGSSLQGIQAALQQFGGQL